MPLRGITTSVKSGGCGIVAGQLAALPKLRSEFIFSLFT